MKHFRVILPFIFFSVAILSWVLLGRVAVSDVAAGVVNPLRQIFFEPDVPTHPILGYSLLCISVASFICGIWSLWHLFRWLRHKSHA
jgi:hypothetical protein